LSDLNDSARNEPGVTADDSPLRLGYIFDSNPDPIRASPGGNPRTIDLRVVISNPRPEDGHVVLRSIAISFPIGQDIDAHLSGDPALPPPALISPGHWTIALNSDRNSVLVRPAAPAVDLTFEGNPLFFAINGIKVNTKPGTVVLEITERSGDGSRVTGEVQLEKRPSNFPVAAFAAEPNVITDVKGTTDLKWRVTEDGRNRSFSVHSRSWRRGGLTAADGERGVRSPAISQRTTFSLDVIHTQGGRDHLEATLRTRVDVTKLELERTHHVALSPTGRLAKIGWLAHNAVRCSVLVNGEVVDDNAPADTYLENDRYFLTLFEEGTYKVEVVAHALNGARSDRLQIGDPITVLDPIHVPISAGPALFRGAGISDDGIFALLSPVLPGLLPARVLDLAQRKQVHAFPESGTAALALLPQPGDTEFLGINRSHAFVRRMIGDLGLRSPVGVLSTHLPQRQVFILSGARFLYYWNYAKSQGGKWDIPGNAQVFAVSCGLSEDRVYFSVRQGPGALGYVDVGDNPPSPGNGDKVHFLRAPIRFLPGQILVTPDGRRAIVSCATANLGATPHAGSVIVDLERDEVIQEMPSAGPGLALLPDGRTAWLGSGKGFSVYDLATDKERVFTPSFPCGVLAVARGTRQPVGLTAGDQGGPVCLI